MNSSRDADRGRSVAEALAGAWRASPPALTGSLGHLAAVAPRLLQTGAGALGWWRTSGGGRHRGAITLFFRDAFEEHSRQASDHLPRLAQLLTVFRSCGLEPLLCKGWSAARWYPEPGVRPHGDIDLCVRPDVLPEAVRLLERAPELSEGVDLHAGVPDLADRGWHELMSRSLSPQVGDTTVRILGPEDHLRLLCLHLMRHGAWRPLWLCDVAATLEALPPGFDWGLCLKGEANLAGWVCCAVGLACRLLDARIAVPPRDGLPPVPDWLVNAVLRAWDGDPGDSHTRDNTPMTEHLLQPAGLPRALVSRWPNPIEAAVRLRASPFTRWPRPLLQAGAYLGRAVRFATRSEPVHATRLFEIHQGR